MPRLQNTLLGWIVGGELYQKCNSNSRPACNVVTNAMLQEQVARFWEQEELRETRNCTKEEAECEQQFTETVTRDSTGRFMVALPKRKEVELGESEQQAIKRLYSIERRFKINSHVKEAYIEFMRDYEEQRHMSLVSSACRNSTETFTLPHQPVIREDSITTKLRVVFDASAKTSTGVSLNDKLMKGPNVQNDIFDIILRFRSHTFVMTADIAAMFRQIMVRQEDRSLQQIKWREDPKQEIKTYQLNTVTYGTASAPYLAIRCLRQLANEEKVLKKAAKVVERDFYMDDVLTGTDNLEEAIELRQQLFELLQKGCFELRKWRSNDGRVLDNLTSEGEVDSLLRLDKEGAIKTLGLLWDAASDTMQYKVNVQESFKFTKRIVLSQIAQIFDPLGLLGPVVINAKCFMQSMWKLKAGWDETLPQDSKTTWNQYHQSLPKINEVRIPRNINPANENGTFDLVGFGDASERAYGACLYAVSWNANNEIESNLIGSKSRVAPLKTVSIPRLELNAALLLTKLCDTARIAYSEKIRNVHLFTDSTIVLSWIAAPPHIRTIYVANRVAKIQALSDNVNWSHVASQDNPADLLSRGMTVDDWKNSSLWWHGPSWLLTGQWPRSEEVEFDETELKASAVFVNTTTSMDICEKFSSYRKLQRVIAYCNRFKANTRKLSEKETGPLTVNELSRADIIIVGMIQAEAFSQELRALKQGIPLPKSSKIAALNPFLDENMLIRVGGRISRATIPELQKHPIVLPDKHHVTKLIMKGAHVKLHHCGPEQLLHSVRQQYWPINGRKEARKVTRNCLRCFRSKPKPPEIIMGDLPFERVAGLVRPFVNAGVDYAGPLQVRESRRRGRVHISKAWIAVFTCLSTKAIHLELVTELSTEAFLAALRRFVARRGICSQLFSDNGTNFVGASRHLKEVYEFLKLEQNTITDHLSKQKIEWKFIPPRAPHFGGLWEAAVKLTKKHLQAVTGGLVFTFEEYYTLLTEIESILNSRPLTPLSSDPNDMSVLTPAHFLIGDTLSLPVEPDYLNTKTSLSRWQHMQKVRQHFWQRWHIEYLQELQKRSKWCFKADNLEKGTLVLIKEDNVPPLHWVLGRVEEVHPGADQVVRVATVRTPKGLFKRAVKNLCPVPIEDS